MVLPYERRQARYASGQEPPLPPHSASPTFPSPGELPEPHEVQLRAWRTGKRGWSGGLTPSVLMPKPASPLTPVLGPSKGRFYFSGCGRQLCRARRVLTAPVPFPQEPAASTDAESSVPIAGGSLCHSAGTLLSTKAIFRPGG